MNFYSVFYYLIINPIVNILEVCFKIIQEITGSNGIAIIGLSFVVSICCLPLYIVAEALQEKERTIQKNLKGGIDRIKKSFKGDEQYMILSTYYKQNHYHPLMALRSSYSLLIQIPFFIAAYTFLSHLKPLENSSFLFIQNLGAPDHIFKIKNFYINILPVTMTLINCISGVIYSKGHNKSEKIQIFVSAFIFLILLYNSPSGLVFYWTMNNVFSLVKNLFYKFKNPKKVIYILLLVAGSLAVITGLVLDTKTIYKAFIMLIGLLLITSKYLVILFSKLSNRFIHEIEKDKSLRFKIYIISAVLLTILTGLFIPSNLIESEVEIYCYIDNYTTPFPFIFITFLKALGYFGVWFSLFYSLSSEKGKNIFTFILFALSVIATVNVFAFSGKYGPIHPFLIFMQAPDFIDDKSFLLISTLVGVILFAAIILLFGKAKKYFYYLNVIIVLSLCIITSRNLLIIKKSANNIPAPNITDNLDPVYHLSKTEKNVIVIMQDRAIPSYFQEFLEERPDMYEKYNGFVFYPNCVSFGNCTMVGTPGIFGGYDYTPYESNLRTDKNMREKRNEAILTMPVLFLNEGYDVTVSDIPYENFLTYPITDMYTDYPEINRQNVMGKYTDLWYKNHNIEKNNILSSRIIRNFIFFSFFKILPPVLRPVLYHREYWVSDEDFDNFETFINSYSVIEYLPKIVSTDNAKGSFLLVDNETVHEPVLLQYPDYVPQKNITDIGNSKRNEDEEYHVMAGTFLKYLDFFDYLKKEGVWDNTKIIFVSDHGFTYETGNYDNSNLPFLIDDYTAFLMVKDFNASEPLRIDNTFMTNADTPAIALKDIIENPKNPFTGNPLKVEDKAPLMKLDMGLAVSTRIRNESKYPVKDDEWWGVKDNIFLNENWYQWKFEK